jgi:hypothetical protein
MIHGLWLPALFERNNTQYRISEYNFKPAYDAGVRFVVGEMNESFTAHNQTWPDLVQAAYDAGIPVVIGVLKVDVPKYYNLYHEVGFWEDNTLLANDPVWWMYANAIRNKFMQGAILEFVGTAMKNGEDLPENWFNRIYQLALARWSANSQVINKRLTADRIFPMISQDIINKKYQSVGDYNYQHEPLSVVYPGYDGQILNSCAYSNMFSIFSSSTVGIKPELSYCNNWLFWQGADLFIDPPFQYPSGAALIKTCAFNGTLSKLYERFRPDYAEPQPEEPQPEELPVEEPKYDPFQQMRDAIKSIQINLGSVLDALSNLQDERNQ